MTGGWQAFAATFRPWLSNRVELSFGPDPERHGTMTNGQGPGVLAAIEAYARTMPFAGSWIDDVRRLCTAVEPFGYFCKADWHQGQIERLTVYCRFRNGTVEQSRLGESSRASGFGWPAEALSETRAALGTEPFLMGLRVDRDGRRHLSVYYVVRPSFDTLVNGLMPALSGACGLPAGVPEAARTDLGRLHDPETFGRYGLELGVQSSEGSDELRATAYLREIAYEPALGFVASTGDDGSAGRLAELAAALPGRRFLYVGVRYDRAGRNGWKLYTLLRPTRPVEELPLAGPPVPELLRSGFREPATGAALI